MFSMNCTCDECGNYFSENEETYCENCMSKLDEQIEQLKKDLVTAINYLKQGKAQFCPTTTNSDVDVFLEKMNKEYKMLLCFGQPVLGTPSMTEAKEALRQMEENK